MTPRHVTVTVKPGRVVYVDGVAHDPGQDLHLPAPDAETLIDQGLVEKPPKA